MGTFIKEITSAQNDGYRWDGPFWHWYYDDLYLGYSSAIVSNIKFALRFTDVSIPQGATITSAKISLKTWYEQTADIHAKIYGIDEDNTAIFPTEQNPADVPTERTHTTAAIDWDRTDTIPSETYFDTSDITSIVQEIVNRGGWSSGNAMGFVFENDGMTDDVIFYDYDRWHGSYDSGKYAVLTIVYAGQSPSASTSPSSSVSPSVSASTSPSASVSPSASPSPSPMPPYNPAVVKIAKPGVNVLTNSDPEKLIFSSEFGTLKYFDKQALNLSINAADGDVSCKGEITHNLGYYPYVEVFVSVYIGEPTGEYEYCPFAGSGASVAYNANVKLTTDKITVYGDIIGISDSTWHFDFLVFVYKNDLGL